VQMQVAADNVGQGWMSGSVAVAMLPRQVPGSERP